MFQLVYVSVAVSPFSEVALRALLTFARARNTARGITGVLLYQNDSFMQALEGERAVVEEIFAKIQRDPRHRDVRVLSRAVVASRNFGDWSMGFVDVRAAAIALPGFRSDAEFQDLAGDTASIQRVIDGFRDGSWQQLQTR